MVMADPVGLGKSYRKNWKVKFPIGKFKLNCQNGNGKSKSNCQNRNGKSNLVWQTILPKCHGEIELEELKNQIPKTAMANKVPKLPIIGFVVFQLTTGIGKSNCQNRKSKSNCQKEMANPIGFG
jgi:hypothetical protein